MEGSSLLHQACKSGDIGLATQLIKDGASINITDNAGYSPFMDAISNRKYAVLLRQLSLEHHI